MLNWLLGRKTITLEEKLTKQLHQLVKETVMAGYPGVPAPGSLDFPSMEDGWWSPAGVYRNRSKRGDNPQAYLTEDDLKRSRERSRLLATANEYARNALAVRQAYIVGTGIKTTAMPRKGAEQDAGAIKLADEVQSYLEKWSALVKLPKLQKEAVMRADRDGEVFLRSYRRDALELRFIEPENVGDDGETPFGIKTDPNDITEIVAYLVRGGDGDTYKQVKAEDVLHIKCNTDSGIKRGLPFLYPIFNVLEKIEKVDENMAAIIAIQAAIAMIRRNPVARSSAVTTAISSNADQTRSNPYTGGTDYYKKYRAGTILDVDGNTEYEFPAIGANIGGITEAKSSLLRTAAAGVCMAEYMLTSDASNGNFASTQVAESPCISIFLSTQNDYCEIFGNGAYVEGADNGLQWDAIEYAVKQGQLDEATLEMVVLKSEGPNIVVRDRTQESTRLSMLASSGIISRDEWAKAEGRDKAAKSDEEVQAEKDAEMQKQAAMAQAKQKPAGVKEQFDEDKHPRDENGKFAGGGSMTDHANEAQSNIKSHLKDFTDDVAAGIDAKSFPVYLGGIKSELEAMASKYGVKTSHDGKPIEVEVDAEARIKPGDARRQAASEIRDHLKDYANDLISAKKQGIAHDLSATLGSMAQSMAKIAAAHGTPLHGMKHMTEQMA